MNSIDEFSRAKTEITLGVLTAVESDRTVTQRTIASELGIALGLTNAYLKRCIKKGYIKVGQIPRNRYAYYLTPKGFAEKSRLTALYLSQSFQFFRSARSQCEAIFAQCESQNWMRVLLVGTGDLGEIAYYCSRESAVGVVAFFDPHNSEATFHGRPVTADPAIFEAVDAALITDLTDPQDAYDTAAAIPPPDRVLALRMLMVSTNWRASRQGETP